MILAPVRLPLIVFGLMLLSLTATLSIGRLPTPNPPYLAFERLNLSGLTDLYIIRPDGSGLRRLTDTASFSELTPVWSPDGRWVTYTVTTNRTNIYRFNIHNGRVERLTNSEDFDTYGVWDRERLVYISNGGVNAVTPGRPPTPLTRIGTAFVTTPLLTHAGKLFFIAQYQQESKLYRFDENGLFPLSGEDVYHSTPTLSPNGRWLVVQSGQNAAAGLARIDATLGDETPLPLPGAFFPAWSARDELAYIVQHNRAQELYIVPLQDGQPGNPQRVTHFNNPDAELGAPVWSSDGRWLTLPVTDGFNTDFYVLNRDSGDLLPLAHSPFDERSPSFAPIIALRWSGVLSGLIGVGVLAMACAWEVTRRRARHITH